MPHPDWSSGELPQQGHRAVTEQEQFWAGDFGHEYTDRNAVSPAHRRPFFESILRKIPTVSGICELGANRGHNLLAIQSINPQYHLTGVELNDTAYDVLASHEGIEAVHAAIQDVAPVRAYDLVFTCGVLIHINPADLPAIYRKMAALSQRYVLINEYFNPVPVEVSYRGHTGKLFKRDFGGEFLNANPNQFRLVDYGFLWQRVEPAWDNTTWWLFEVTQAPAVNS